MKRKFQIDFKSFCQEHGISCYTEGFKQCRPGSGWIQLQCPYCAPHSDKPFLGYNEAGNFFYCWQCGTHPVIDTLLLISKLPYSRLLSELTRYQSNIMVVQKPRKDMSKKSFMEKPKWWGEFSPRHIDYLAGRGFNPERTIREWKLFASGHQAPAGFTFRVIIPIYDEQDRILSYTSRAISDKAKLKYKACPETETTFSTKECIYGLNNVLNDSILIVEGPTDVWKMGAGAVCPCGIAFTPRQIRILSAFTKRYILFDNEEEAQVRANTLGEELDCFGGETWILRNTEYKDPGEMPEAKARKLASRILQGR